MCLPFLPSVSLSHPPPAPWPPSLRQPRLRPPSRPARCPFCWVATPPSSRPSDEPCCLLAPLPSSLSTRPVSCSIPSPPVHIRARQLCVRASAHLCMRRCMRVCMCACLPCHPVATVRVIMLYGCRNNHRRREVRCASRFCIGLCIGLCGHTCVNMYTERLGQAMVGCTMMN